MARGRAKEKTEFGESCQRILWFLKRYTFTCDVIIYDAASFSMIFSAMTTRLLEWHKKRGRQGVGLTVTIATHTAVINLVKSRMTELYRSDKPYDFVKKLNISLIIKNIDDSSEETYVPVHDD
jgi:hypothetical protein